MAPKGIEKPHWLFVCGRNLRRSPTAEAIYRNDPRIAARSAGLSEQSPHRLRAADLAWADLVFVMERKYQARIQREHRGQTSLPPMVFLDIPDEFDSMDSELINLIELGTEPYLKELSDLERGDESTH